MSEARFLVKTVYSRDTNRGDLLFLHTDYEGAKARFFSFASGLPTRVESVTLTNLQTGRVIGRHSRDPREAVLLFESEAKGWHRVRERVEA